MITSFKCKDTEKLFNDYGVKRFKQIERKARIKLEVLNAAVSLDSLRVPPGNRLEVLTGDRKGNILYASIISGEFASNGLMEKHIMSR
jgi:toxin HigB-1